MLSLLSRTKIAAPCCTPRETKPPARSSSETGGIANPPRPAGVKLHLGPSAVAAGGLVLCCAHVAIALSLGRMYEAKKRQADAAGAAAEGRGREL